jgi:hypothetical protein
MRCVGVGEKRFSIAVNEEDGHNEKAGTEVLSVPACVLDGSGRFLCYVSLVMSWRGEELLATKAFCS